MPLNGQNMSFTIFWLRSCSRVKVFLMLFCPSWTELAGMNSPMRSTIYINHQHNMKQILASKVTHWIHREKMVTSRTIFLHFLVYLAVVHCKVHTRTDHLDHLIQNYGRYSSTKPYNFSVSLFISLNWKHL